MREGALVLGAERLAREFKVGFGLASYSLVSRGRKDLGRSGSQIRVKADH